MAKRTKQDDETRAAIEQLENEGGPTIDHDGARILTYRGAHPLIRRCGYAFAPHEPRLVPAGIAAVLTAVPDFEDTTPAAPDASDFDLPPAA